MSSLNLNDLATVINGILVAQKRGVYSLKESSTLSGPVENITAIIKSINDEDSNDDKQPAAQPATQPAAQPVAQPVIEEIDEA